jgi:hypothetical protein
MKIETMDAEILVGTTSGDLFSEIVDRLPSMTALFEAYKREKCDLPPQCSAAHGCDTGPLGRTYCFMNFFKTMMHHDWKNVKEFLDIFDAQKGDGRALISIDLFLQKKRKQEMIELKTAGLDQISSEPFTELFDEDEEQTTGFMSALRRIFGGK